MRFPTSLELLNHPFITTHSQQVINPSLISVKKNARFFFSRYYCYKVASDISMSDTTFWKYSLRIFQGCCLLFNYQGSMLFFVVSLATAILDYHSFRRLSTTFSNFFICFFRSIFICYTTTFTALTVPYSVEEKTIASLRRLLIISASVLIVNPFFIFFSVFYKPLLRRLLHLIYLPEHCRDLHNRIILIQ